MHAAVVGVRLDRVGDRRGDARGGGVLAVVQGIAVCRACLVAGNCIAQGVQRVWNLVQAAVQLGQLIEDILQLAAEREGRAEAAAGVLEFLQHAGDLAAGRRVLGIHGLLVGLREVERDGWQDLRVQVGEAGAGQFQLPAAGNAQQGIDVLQGGRVVIRVGTVGNAVVKARRIVDDAEGAIQLGGQESAHLALQVVDVRLLRRRYGCGRQHHGLRAGPCADAAQAERWRRWRRIGIDPILVGAADGLVLIRRNHCLGPVDERGQGAWTADGDAVARHDIFLEIIGWYCREPPRCGVVVLADGALPFQHVGDAILRGICKHRAMPKCLFFHEKNAAGAPVDTAAPVN